jgi:hypothetical protein
MEMRKAIRLTNRRLTSGPKPFLWNAAIRRLPLGARENHDPAAGEPVSGAQLARVKVTCGPERVPL